MEQSVRTHRFWKWSMVASMVLVALLCWYGAITKETLIYTSDKPMFCVEQPPQAEYNTFNFDRSTGCTLRKSSLSLNVNGSTPCYIGIMMEKGVLLPRSSDIKEILMSDQRCSMVTELPIGVTQPMRMYFYDGDRYKFDLMVSVPGDAQVLAGQEYTLFYENVQTIRQVIRSNYTNCPVTDEVLNFVDFAPPYYTCIRPVIFNISFSVFLMLNSVVTLVICLTRLSAYTARKLRVRELHPHAQFLPARLRNRILHPMQHFGETL